MARSRKRQPTTASRKWPCVFVSPIIRERADPWVAGAWMHHFQVKAPFGDLRNQWRKNHCRTLNPYGSESCPYAPVECARAFAEAVAATIRANPKSRVPYFAKVAITSASIRADNKPLARYAQGPSLTRATPESPEPGSGLRGPTPGLVSIGEVLRSLDLGPHQDRPTAGKEGTER